MPQVRLWEVISDQQLEEIRSTSIDLEKRLEGWLESDISVLASNLLVIGKQVRTDFGGVIDLLCLDDAGNTVVVELKRGKTPRDATAQALDYASWVKDLSFERITEIADEHFGRSDSLSRAFRDKFELELPKELNVDHRSLVVAETPDDSTERIVRYLSDLNVPINVTTVHHFKDKSGREILAQVYLIEPEVAKAKSRSTSKRGSTPSLADLQAMAEENGIGNLYKRIREGVRGILSASSVAQSSVGYTVKTDGGGERSVLLVRTYPGDEGGLPFVVHATRFDNYMGVCLEKLQTWLPENMVESDVRGWARSSPEERENASGLKGVFQKAEEIDTFLKGLRTLRGQS